MLLALGDRPGRPHLEWHLGQRRDIWDTNPNPVGQFNDLVAGFGTRDISGRPLGDVMGHSVARLRTCYGILHAAQLAAASASLQLGSDEPRLTTSPAGAPPQDRKHTKEFPAAHRSPCRLIVTRGWALRPNIPLYQIYRDGISQGFVRGLFGKTDIVHVLTNRADSHCEGFNRHDKLGTAHILVDCCNRILRDQSLKPRDVFFDALVPGFRRVAIDRLDDRTSTLLTQFPGADDISPIVDANGRLFAAPPTPNEDSINSPVALTRQTNYQALIQILQTYANTDIPTLADLNHIAGQFTALRANEIAACRREM
jgi:hypothetical protein